MNSIKDQFPLLLKRKHIKDIGISDALYYKLIKSGQLPTIKLNNRTYINRDVFFELMAKQTHMITDTE